MARTDKSSFPDAFVSDLRVVQWLDPWWCFCLDDPALGLGLEEELQKELCDKHPLHAHRQSARAIAKRGDCDDVLFWMPQAEQTLAIVHLTWKGRREENPIWPHFSLVTSLTQFVEQEMVPTNRE